MEVSMAVLFTCMEVNSIYEYMYVFFTSMDVHWK